MTNSAPPTTRKVEEATWNAPEDGTKGYWSYRWIDAPTPPTVVHSELSPMDWFIRSVLAVGFCLIVVWAWPKLMQPACDGCLQYESQNDAYARMTHEAEELERNYRNSIGDEDEILDHRSVAKPGYIDCDSFDTQRKAQRFYEDTGGPQFAPYYLDGDGDGIACEWNP